MLKPVPGMGNKSKSEALYFSKKSPKFRGYEDYMENVNFCDNGPNPAFTEYLDWMTVQWGKNGSKLLNDGVIDFLGLPPKLKNLASWMKLDVEPEKKSEELKGFHSQVPHELLCDPTIPHAAVRLYAIYHKFCRIKNLAKRPKTYVGKKKISELMGVSEVYIWTYTKLLQERDWIEVKYRKGTTNIVILNGTPNIKNEK